MRARRSSRSASGNPIVNGRTAVASADLSGVADMRGPPCLEAPARRTEPDRVNAPRARGWTSRVLRGLKSGADWERRPTLRAPTPRRQRTRMRSVVALHRPRRQSDEMAGAPVGVGSQVSAAPRGHGMDAAAEAASRRRATPSLSGGLHRPPLSLSMHLSRAMTAARRSAVAIASAWMRSCPPTPARRPLRTMSKNAVETALSPREEQSRAPSSEDGSRRLTRRGSGETTF